MVGKPFKIQSLYHSKLLREGVKKRNESEDLPLNHTKWPSEERFSQIMKIKKLYSFRATFALLSLLSVFAGCSSKTESANDSTTVTSDKNFYTEKVEVAHSKGFTIEYFDHYKIVHIISPFDKTSDTTKYVLLERGTKKPSGYADHETIEIPIRSLAAMSSMHVGLLDFLNANQVLTGLGSLQYVYSPQVIKLIDEGKIAEVGRNEGLNEELLVSMHPDLIMTMGNPGAGLSHYKTLDEAGIPVMINSEWVETTPLARAEWVKLMAALLNKEALVNQKFSVVEKEYRRLTLLAKQIKAHPTVLSGLNTKDAWFIPGGDSYMARFFSDAGADYHWNSMKSTGSLSLSFESVYPIALKADYWMNVGFDKKNKKGDVLALDARYSDFKAYKSGQMYSYNNRVNDKGSNDFFESGNVNPHTVLADLIKIFHPDLLPEHKLVYYKKLE
jgi:iron complex transport system substrate-binding protein